MTENFLLPLFLRNHCFWHWFVSKAVSNCSSHYFPTPVSSNLCFTQRELSKSSSSKMSCEVESGQHWSLSILLLHLGEVWQILRRVCVIECLGIYKKSNSETWSCFSGMILYLAFSVDSPTSPRGDNVTFVTVFSHQGFPIRTSFEIM